MRVLIFGDSIAQGFFDRQGGWANRLRQHYDTMTVSGEDASYTQPTVFNLGVSGDMAQNILQRIDNEISARRWPGEEFAIVIAIGVNDSRFKNGAPMCETSEYVNTLERILSVARKYTSKILFVGLFPVIDELLNPPSWETNSTWNTQRVKEFNTNLGSFCETNNIATVKLWDVFEQEDLQSVLFDGLHPNDKGHQLIAEIVRLKLEEIMA